MHAHTMIINYYQLYNLTMYLWLFMCFIYIYIYIKYTRMYIYIYYYTYIYIDIDVGVSENRSTEKISDIVSQWPVLFAHQVTSFRSCKSATSPTATSWFLRASFRGHSMISWDLADGWPQWIRKLSHVCWVPCVLMDLSMIISFITHNLTSALFCVANIYI